MYKNGLIKKISGNQTSLPGKQNFLIHISAYISRSRGNQKMIFGQLIIYKMRIIFLEKLIPTCLGETIIRPFSNKNQNCAYLWINSLKFYVVCIYCMPSSGLSKYIETKLQINGLYFLQSFIKKTKRGL